MVTLEQAVREDQEAREEGGTFSRESVQVMAKRGATPITDGDGNLWYPVPSGQEFEEGFCEGRDIGRIADRLIEDRPELSHLQSIQISYWWKDSKGGKGNCKVLGAASKPSGLVRRFTGADFLIVLNAKSCSGLRAAQIEALIYHELRHCELDPETLEPLLVDHDWAGFRTEIEHYGLWSGDDAGVAEAFKQLELPLPPS